MGSRWKRLGKAFVMNTLNTCFRGELRNMYHFIKVKNTSPGAVDCYSYNKQLRNKFLMLTVSRSLHLAPFLIDSETFLDETSYTYWICHDNFTTVACCDAVTYFSSSVEHSKAVFWWAQNSHISDFSLRVINTLSGEANLHKKKSIKKKKKQQQQYFLPPFLNC